MRAVLAFKAFCIAHPNEPYKFKIVGQQDGFINDDEGLKNLLLNDDFLRLKIEFTGFVNDQELRSIYENAYCLIFPSLYEGFGLPPLEAMKLGTPAIVSNHASMPELCGDAVLYFDPEDVESIKKSMETIIFSKDVYLDLVQRGRKQALTYEWSKAALQHKILIQGLLSSEKF
jgi:glycosyltransferase involved in cell wall biosynthesis